MTFDKKCTLRAYLIQEEGYDTSYSNIESLQNDDTLYLTDNGVYMVLDDDEANELADECIIDILWAFNAEFIIDHTKLPYDAIDMIELYQNDKCESANDTIYALIDDIDEFIDAAICCDGRGHFLNTYDGGEIKYGDYYIYRMD